MQITIIGTGQMARGIATRALAGRHAVTLVGRHGATTQALADDLPGRVKVASVGDPLQSALVVLAVPYRALEEVLWRYAPQLDGRVLVDVTNPLTPLTLTRVGARAGSAAQEIAIRAPRAKVVKAFNTTLAGLLARGVAAEQPLDVLIAADDEPAKQAVMTVATDGGLRALDAGPLARARELEALGYLHMCLQPRLGAGVASTIKVLVEPVSEMADFVPARIVPRAERERRLTVLSPIG